MFKTAIDLSNSFHPVPKQKTLQKTQQKNDKPLQRSAEMKKKSKKLAKLERQRDKDIVKEGECEFCHNYSKHLDPHEVYGGSNRQRSITNGFVKLLCRKCHSDEKIIEKLKIDTQKKFEKTRTREEFISLVGKSYLKKEEI